MSAWPTIAEAAFHGPAGEFVLRTEPHSEAHPMALSQFLGSPGIDVVTVRTLFERVSRAFAA